ncbi:MAG: SDR family NAD(P)-dependent oxidoreductase [Notoacmeibacter sp.]|nr:SDR family NAD(P)-dependent oxidoreductase [Notoacmeibacter sp.]
MKTIVITGVSSGIGHATAKTLVSKGWRVFGTVRKSEQGERLSAEFGPSFTPLLVDVRDEAAVRAAADQVAGALGNERLQGLINFAGIETVDALAVVPIADVQDTFDVHVFGMLRMVQAFLPLLGSDEARQGPKGRIINISSVVGKWGAPYFGTYSSAKHAVEGMTDAMRREFAHVGVDAIVIRPGNTKSGVFEKVRADHHDYIRGTIWEKPVADFRKLFLDGAINGWPMARVVAVIEKALTAKHPRAAYVAAAERIMNYTAPTLSPPRLVDKVLQMRIALRSRKPESGPQAPE